MMNNDMHLRRDSGSGSRHYLEATVQTASPARLRLMLIERAVDVAGCLAQTWRSKQSLGSNEQSITLLDLLSELLAGVVGGETEAEKDVCRKVADLYVFLSKHLVAAEENSDADAIEEIKTVLEVEAETWRAVCAQSARSPNESEPSSSAQGGLNLEA